MDELIGNNEDITPNNKMKMKIAAISELEGYITQYLNSLINLTLFN